MDGARLGCCVGRVAARGPQTTHRRDGDQGAPPGRQCITKLLGAGHQAVEVDIDDAAKGVDPELFAAIGDRALAQHQHIKCCQRWRSPNRFEITHIHLGVAQALQIGARLALVIGRRGTGAPDLHLRAVPTEGLGDAVADATGAADHQYALVREVQRIGNHGLIPLRRATRG